MRRSLILLALSFATACSADQFVSPSDGGAGNDATPDVSVTDAISPDANPLVEGGQADAGLQPQLVPGIPAAFDLYGVWGLSPSDYWVVGGDNSGNGFIGHWTGNTFVNATSAAPVTLRSVWGTALGVFFVGDKDPTSFAFAAYAGSGAPTPIQSSPILSGHGLVSVWYDETNNLYALQTDAYVMARSSSPFTTAADIGSQISQNAGPCFAMHARYAACDGGVYGPGASSPLSGSTGLKLRAIHVVNSSDPLLFVAGDSGFLARNTKNGGWQSIAGAPGGENLEGIWTASLGETVAVGTNGTIVGMSGFLPTPTVVSIQSPNTENLHAVTAVGQGVNRIFVAVGDKGTVITRKF